MYRFILFLFFLGCKFCIAEAQQTTDIFLEDFHGKTAEIPVSFIEVEKPSHPVTTIVEVDFADVVTPVSKYLFGNNANVYMTQMVDQPVLLDHIRLLSPNVIRYPGGNLSSVFFWNAQPGQPPSDAPVKLRDASGQEVDPGYWYGLNNQGWTLSVDNYYAMLEATNAAGILTVNYGYARYSTAEDPVASAAYLAAEWVRYDNGRTKFWEIGNESNGTWQAGHRIDPALNKDGQPAIITGALYGKHFRVFADSMRRAAAEIGHTIYVGAQLLAEEPANWWNDTDRHWNEGVLAEAGNDPDFHIIHSYYTPYETDSGPGDILNSATAVTTDMIAYVNASVSDAGLDNKPLALTEWNIFAEGSMQQVSFINGMHAAIVLGELIKNGYGLACRWDLANGWNNGNDHGMFSQGDEPGIPRWNPRPAYYYMYYFQKYFGDQMLRTMVSGSAEVLAYASRYASDDAALVLINKGVEDQTVLIDMAHYGYGEKYYFHTLTGGTDNDPFSLKVLVNSIGPSLSSGGPPSQESIKPRASSIGSGVKLELPARSVQYVLVEGGDRIITGMDEESEKEIRIYPNPVRNEIAIRFSTPGFSNVSILDLQGRCLYHEGIDLSAREINLVTQLPPGIYLVQLYKGENVYRRKIFIH